MSTKYTLTKEHEAQMRPWAEKWIQKALVTRPFINVDYDIVTKSVEELYAAAKLERPTVVVVTSPFVGAYAAGAAAWIHYCREQGKPVPTRATSALRTPTYVNTWNAIMAAIGDNERIDVNHVDATALESWMVAGACRQACSDIAGVDGLKCASLSHRMMNSGNQWPGWTAFLSFFRHVVKLDIDYSKWQWYEQLTEYGPRWMHRKFCMVCEFPDVLTVDGQRRSHGEKGPFIRWRDGTGLYVVHGVRVPGWVVEHPERMTVETINQESNAEVRRVMLERYGFARYAKDADMVVVDDKDHGVAGLKGAKLLRRNLDGDEPLVVLQMVNSTPEPDGEQKIYLERVPPTMRTTLEAAAWRFDVSEDEYRQLSQET